VPHTAARLDIGPWRTHRTWLGRCCLGGSQRPSDIGPLRDVQFAVLVARHPCDELAAYIAIASDRGEIRSKIEVWRLGLLLADGYFAAVLRWLEHDPSPFDLHDELRGLLNIILRGILGGDADAPATADR
jgi:hypothetical protein